MTQTAPIALVAAMVISLAAPVFAQGSSGGFLSRIFGSGEPANLRATIWVDPDGCEHWVIDDGAEGYMSQHLDPHGKPVCRGKQGSNGICKTFEAAALFGVGSARVSSDARSSLQSYFETIPGRKIIVSGHTDSTGGEDANLNLSLRRASAVASIAAEMGVNAEARGFGETVPLASNDTTEGRARNRRVELTCM